MKAMAANATSSTPTGMGWAVGASVAAHGVALAVIVWGWGTASLPQGVPVMDVELVVAAASEPGGRSPEPAATPTPGIETPSATARPPEPLPPMAASAPTAPEKAATADLAVVLPAPEPLPAVQSQDWRQRPAPPLTSVPPEPAPTARTTPSPQTSGPSEPPSAAPPPSATSPRPAAPTPSVQSPRQATSTSAPSTAPPPTAVSTQVPAQPAPASTPSTALPRPAAPSVSSQPPRQPASAFGQGPATDPPPTGAGVTTGTAQLVRHVAPVYPTLARERGQEGKVVVRLVVGADGVPADIRIADSSGVAALDIAALEAVRQWRFAPARRAGVAVPEEHLAPVVFRLRH